ncbi:MULTISPECIES: ankyrin repeat domain-containing protein [unclassified Massilia]|uniref:ankyrin repeat domain-containing protein n=1 Tax=unclassified Massilia TaxID=2609279 RepID=UPI00177DBD8E|nr:MULTISPECIES: ankyrin repeat domain-containing protein [unclassified Massilia]MBD8531897.1 ankyrin repeat domain-containing protein [Massilia sp. CFBP 13647]MBD8675342.1 ankyrin repeat domain-containing protein [Massilia sp. CFBP 13721]
MHPKRRLVLKGIVLSVGLASGLAAAALKPPSEAELTTFFRSVQVDDVRTVKAMLGTVVNANQPNPIGGEPGMVQALREEAMRVFQVFLDHPGTNLEAKAANGNTALMMAAFKRNRAAVEALLAKGAAVNQPGWTALHYAAASGDEDIVRLLIARGAKVDAVSPKASGAYTPMMMAAREGHDGAALVLIAHGADRMRRNTEGLTAVQLAERAGKPRVARALEQGG